MFKNLLKQFTNKKTFHLMLASAAALFSAEQACAGFVHTNGTKIVDGNGSPLFFTGANLGNWLVWEGYLMMGVKDGDPAGIGFRTHSQLFGSLADKFGGGDTGRNLAISFEREWRLNYVNEQMIKDLHDKGYNSVRVPFNYRLFWDVYNNRLTDEGFAYIDRLLMWCKTYNIYILLDMHGAPGYQNPGDHSDNEKGNWYPSDTDAYRETVGFWSDSNNLDIASKVWSHIASHYAQEEQIWGYDLINEPVPQESHRKDLLPSMKKITAAIRAVDKNHTIVAEGAWWASDFAPLDWKNPQTQLDTGTYAQWDSNLVYQTHHYPAKEEDIPALFPRVDLTNKLGIPLIVGEIGETWYPDWQRTMANWAAINTAGYFPWTSKKVRSLGAPWTVPVPSGSTFDNVMTDIKYKIPGGNSGNAQSMIDFARYNIGNGQLGVSFNQGFYDWIRLKTNTPNLTGRYYLRNLNSKLVLDVTSWRTDDGAPLQQYVMGTNSPANQQFDLIDNGDGTYAIRNFNSGKVLDVKDSSQDNDKVVQQWTYYKGAANQSFIFSLVPGTNSYQIIAKHSGKPIEVVADSTSLGAAVQQRVDNNAARSQWELIPVNPPAPPAFYYSQEAENNVLSKSSNVTTQVLNGQTFLGNFVQGSWVSYNPQHFKPGTYKVTIQAATGLPGMKIRFDLKAGTYVSADTEVPSVSNVWDSWKNVTMTINVPVEGDFNLGIQSSSGYVNVNRFTISQ